MVIEIVKVAAIDDKEFLYRLFGGLKSYSESIRKFNSPPSWICRLPVRYILREKIEDNFREKNARQ